MRQREAHQLIGRVGAQRVAVEDARLPPAARIGVAGEVEQSAGMAQQHPHGDARIEAIAGKVARHRVVEPQPMLADQL
jgi:flagella basal body P-ring formation protein FlgA